MAAFFTIIRSLAKDDTAKIELAAQRFCKRHGISFDEFTPAELAIDHHLHQCGDSNLKRNWQRCFCRAAGIEYNRRAQTYGNYYLAVRCE